MKYFPVFSFFFSLQSIPCREVLGGKKSLTNKLCRPVNEKGEITVRNGRAKFENSFFFLFKHEGFTTLNNITMKFLRNTYVTLMTTN